MWIVTTCHGGSAWCVRDAEPGEDPSYVFDSHEEAMAAARASAREIGCEVWDFSTEGT